MGKSTVEGRAQKWQPIAKIPNEQKDGRRVWVKRVHERRIVKEGWAVWDVNCAEAPMRQWDDGGLDGPIPPDTEYADTARWLTEDRMYSFPEPTHWLPSKAA